MSRVARHVARVELPEAPRARAPPPPAPPGLSTSRRVGQNAGRYRIAMTRPSDSYRRIYDVVSRIPRGRVANYGQVAELAGLPRQARLVGYALNVLPPDSDVPWHRVVNAQGRISLRGGGLGHEELQAQMLRREGVRFVAGAVPLDRYRWEAARPDETRSDRRGRAASRRTAHVRVKG